MCLFLKHHQLLLSPVAAAAESDQNHDYDDDLKKKMLLYLLVNLFQTELLLSLNHYFHLLILKHPMFQYPPTTKTKQNIIFNKTMKFQQS